MKKGDYVISLSNVTKNFDDVRALDNLSLDVEPGIFGLIGPNGAGKTTILRILLGLIRPSNGSATVLNLDSSKDSRSIRNRIGVLHERPSLPDSFTAIQYLKGVIRIYSSGKDPMDLLQIVGLEDSAHRTIGNFSAGMRQRLGVALALSGNPQLVFLDEPTSNLDVQSRDQIIDLIGTLYHDSGVSFVINSHVLSELERVCSHIAFIDKGKIIENGEIQTIIQQYTQDVYRIRCSDARKLFTETKQIPQVKASRLVGTTIISITVEEPHIETIKADIKRIADSLGVTLYGIEVTKTLEDAFREAI